MEVDHPTTADLFREFLNKCEQIDEPKVNRTLVKIRQHFEEVDPSYRESEVFRSFLQKVIQKLMVNPWKSMKTVADDLKYHTFQVDPESTESRHNSNEEIELERSFTFAPSIIPKSIQPIAVGDQISRNIIGSSSSEASFQVDKGSCESHESPKDNREYNTNGLNRFAMEDLLSRIDSGINKSVYDEAECIHLINLAKIEKLKKIENLKINLMKLNLDISKIGSREIPVLSDEIASLNKVRSLMRKYLEVHEKICQLSNETRGKEVIKFMGTNNDFVDQAIEKFYNEYDSMNLPLLEEICDVIRNENIKKSLLLEQNKIPEMATVALQELGHIRHKQRAEEFQNFISSYMSMESEYDPASANPELQKKLSENEKLNQKRMDFIINEYESRETLRFTRVLASHRASILSNSLADLDIGDFLRSLMFPSSDEE